MSIRTTLSAAIIMAALAVPAQAFDLPHAGSVSASSRSDSGRYEIFRGMGRMVPGAQPGFVGDAVRTSDNLYIGSVDEVYVREHVCRVLVVGIAREANEPYAIEADFIYVTLPWSAPPSDGSIRLPYTLREVSRRF